MSDAAQWQTVLARYLTDPVFEAEVRASPDAVAAQFGVDPSRTAWLARLDPKRVAAFRRSAFHKERRRAG